jgi:hypothetical protein
MLCGAGHVFPPLVVVKQNVQSPAGVPAQLYRRNPRGPDLLAERDRNHRRGIRAVWGSTDLPLAEILMAAWTTWKNAGHTSA